MEVRKFRKRHAKVIMESNGEVLAAPGTDVSRWMNRFRQRVRARTIAAAPSHNYAERPLRPHPTTPLKKTITSSASKRVSPRGFFLYAAVGSYSEYALYVDQGTGIFGGNGQYEAKVLPPYSKSNPMSFYEKKPGSKARVFIKGQRGQHFFEKGLASAFRSMHLRSIRLPGEGVGAVRQAATSFPENLFGAGNTPGPGDTTFVDRLEQWRQWKADAYAAESAARATERQARKKPSGTRPDQPAALTPSQLSTARNVISAQLRRMGVTPNRVKNIKINPDGTYSYSFQKAGGVWVIREGRWKS